MDAQRARERARPQQEQRQQQPAQQQRPKNAFAVFAEEEEYEERQAQQEVQKQELQAKQEAQAKEDFPALMGNTRVAQNSNAKSYSCVAATPADERRLELSRQQRAQKAQAPKKAVSWVDEEDDEYDEPQEVEEHINLDEMYGDRMYEILCEYFRNEYHSERTATVVGILLDRPKEELEEFMTNRLYLEEQADEVFAALKQLDRPAYTSVPDTDDW
jgi:hypothetical protein